MSQLHSSDEAGPQLQDDIEISPEGTNPEDISANSSASCSRPDSEQNQHPRRSRVRFTSTSGANDATNTKSQAISGDGSLSPSPLAPPKSARLSPIHSRDSSMSNNFRRTPELERENTFPNPTLNPARFKSRPSLLRNNSSFSQDSEDVFEVNEKTFSAIAAQERAQRVASLVGSHSAPASTRTSLEEDTEEGTSALMSSRNNGYPVRVDDIPLVNMNTKRPYDAVEDDNDENGPLEYKSSTSEARKLVRAHTRKHHGDPLKMPAPAHSGLISGQVTPEEERRQLEDYVPRPQHYRGGVLSSLLKLYNPPAGMQSRRGSFESTGSPSKTELLSTASSGMSTPRTKSSKWYNQRNQSQDTLVGLVEASAILAAPGGSRTPTRGAQRPSLGKRTHSAKLFDATMGKLNSRPRLEDEIRITIHIAETLSRQKYILKLCRALMTFGAPTHRLEEYMRMSARVLEIDSQYLYIPGCMIISFDDLSTHTTEVKLVRSIQGIDLGKLKDIHEVYKEVVHDVIGVEEATQRLDEIIKRKQKHNPWLLVIVYGFASATVGPFAFQARWIDLPPAWLLGCILGYLQLILAPKSELYSNVFEISAAVFTSFLARAFGSIRGGNLFCFSALAQSSIAIILPGYIVLCGSLELQSRSIVAGSVRMVYAIMYSLFLGFGITIGTAFYGLMDSNATSSTTCQGPMNHYYRWPFVVAFTLCLCVINQAKWKQIPVMLFVSFCGYLTNYYSSLKFPSSAPISNTFGALASGVLANLHSRLFHGVAAAVLLPAIFVQVPSGLAASGSLLAGLSTADQITNSSTYANGTAKINGTSMVKVTSTTDLNSIVFNVGYSVIQIAIGITVGLFLSALIIYPLGKRRSGLFSF